MNKLLPLSIFGACLLMGSNSAKAEWDSYGYKGDHRANTGLSIYTVNTQSGASTFLGSYCLDDIYSDPEGDFFCANTLGNDSHIDKTSGNLILDVRLNTESQNTLIEFDPANKTFKEIGKNKRAEAINTFGGNILFERGVLKKNTDGTIQIGTDENNIDITSEGLAIDGEPIITKKANGELHIGKNSWITKEENGRQKVWAKDANGNSIPIDYTNGTKLLINGRDVEQSINNIGALSAALTGLPTVPTDTTLACGLGTGTHGGDFAFSGGCASKVNEKLSINYAASMTMPGQNYAGDFEDKFSARAGFVWKLGKSTKPTQISMKVKEKIELKIKSLEERNQNLENTVSTLMAKLKHLEKIALSEYKANDLATIKMP